MMLYGPQAIYYTPIVNLKMYDWRIAVYNDEGEIRLIPQWRRGASVWMNPSDLNIPMPSTALMLLLEPSKLLALADAVRAAMQTK